MLIVRNKEQTIQEILNALEKATNPTIELIYWELSQAGLTLDYPLDSPDDNNDEFHFARKDGLE